MIILFIEPLRIDISLKISLPDDISLRVAQYDVFPYKTIQETEPKALLAWCRQRIRLCIIRQWIRLCYIPKRLFYQPYEARKWDRSKNWYNLPHSPLQLFIVLSKMNIFTMFNIFFISFIKTISILTYLPYIYRMNSSASHVRLLWSSAIHVPISSAGRK